MPKAKEYFEKYKKNICDKEILIELLKEMNKEVGDIAKVRHATSDDAIRAIVKEINLKWNALGKMLEKEYRQPVLKEDGFLNYWKAKIPQL